MKTKFEGLEHVSDYSYLVYKQAYQKNYEAAKRKGATLADMDMLSRAQFDDWYKAIYNTQKKEMLQGKRKAIGNIPVMIATRQKYYVSEARAKGIQKYWEEATGEHIGIQRIRESYNFDTDAIEATMLEEASLMNKALKEQGITDGKERARIIGIEIFHAQENSL